MISRLQYGLNALGNLLFPQVCSGCGTDLHNAEILCAACISSLPFTNFHLHADNPVEKIFWGRVPLLSAFSYLFFNQHSIARDLLHQLKYGSNKEIGIFFGRRMGQAMQESGRFETITAIIPLPLHASRLRSRGYNQSEMIAEGIAGITGLPIENSLVTRPYLNKTQTHKNRTERWLNTSGKFSIDPAKDLQNNHFLLIDDVVTTGATIESCASLLCSAGASVSVATLAYTAL